MKAHQLGELSTLLNLGHNFFVNARVPDTSKVMVHVGLGHHVEYTLDEAIKYADERLKSLSRYSCWRWYTSVLYGSCTSCLCHCSKTDDIREQMAHVQTDLWMVRCSGAVFACARTVPQLELRGNRLSEPRSCCRQIDDLRGPRARPELGAPHSPCPAWLCKDDTLC